MSPAKVLRNFDIAKASGTLHHTEKFIYAIIYKNAMAFTNGGNILFKQRKLLMAIKAHRETEAGLREVVTNVLP